MDEKGYRSYKKMEKAHSSTCSKCGKPLRNSCKYPDCRVQHCACEATEKQGF